MNHRALITRTLTKYPVDYALFRELLQNSADARAKSAIIHFETKESVAPENLDTIHASNVSKLVFRNDGAVFSEDDWNRLKEIAKGNPNETKIGAFGVGFYSVFELTDTPLVHSGNWVMSFHFEGDELRYSKTESPTFIQGTLIDLPYRRDMTVPSLDKFIAFLTQSFVLLPLNQVKLELNDLQLFEITKTETPAEVLEIPPGLNCYSPNKTLKLNPPQSTALQVDISYLNATQMKPSSFTSASGLFSFGRKMVSSLFTSSENAAEITNLCCFMHRIDASVDVTVSSSFRKKMIDTVLKPPTKKSTMALLSFSKSDQAKSTLKAPLSDCIFPSDFNDAKIVIGFPTKQSTGVKTHLLLNQLIPTMERTAVDMSNAFVKDWNSQLVYMAGVLMRTVYEHELRVAASQTTLDAQLDLASYTMKRFEMSESAPDPNIGSLLASGFWQSSRTILLPSQLGILPSSKVRLQGKIPASLLRNTPILKTTNNDKGSFVDLLKQVGYISEVSPTEVAQDIQRSPIDVAQFNDLIRWLSTASINPTPILHAAVITDKAAGLEGLILGKIKYYQSKMLVPEGMPIPDTCLPYTLSRGQSLDTFDKLGWRELDLRTWTEYIISLTRKNDVKYNVVLNNDFAGEVLTLLSANWHLIDSVQKGLIVKLLEPINCIPTQLGMKMPSESYIKRIPLFPDLPVVSETVLASKGFLLSINVRESVDMAFVLKVLHEKDSTFKWSSEDLVRYFTDNRKSLHSSDWKLLQQGSFFESTSTGKLCMARDLYAPSKVLEELGFDTLKWSHSSWQHSNNQAHLMYKLGLKKYPPVVLLFEHAIKLNKIDTAISFVLDNLNDYQNSADILKRTNLKIIRDMNGNYCAPSQCYYDQEASLFGLNVVTRRLKDFQAQSLGVQVKPPIRILLDAITSNPPSSQMSTPMFAYLSSRIVNFSKEDVKRCQDIALIPIGPKKWEKPENVYLDCPDSELRELFHIIHPSEEAIPFLQMIGVRNSPDIREIAWKTVKDPSKVLELVGSTNAYKRLLIKFQAEWQSLRNDKNLINAMKTAPFLLGEKLDKDDDNPSAVLAPAERIVVVDNIIIYNQFRHLLIACPQENVLEDFYMKLGASLLSQSLLERVSMGPEIDVPEGKQLEERIRERLTLFLESTSKEKRVNSSRAGKMKVKFTKSITVERKLKTTPVVKASTTAYSLPREPDVLWLTPNPEWFDVSGVLTKLVLKKPDPESVIVLELQLSSSLDSLQRKGYNVSRILKKQKELEEAKILEWTKQEAENRRKREALEQERAELARVAKPEPVDMKQHLSESKQIDKPVLSNPETQPLLEHAQPKPQNNIQSHESSRAVEPPKHSDLGKIPFPPSSETQATAKGVLDSILKRFDKRPESNISRTSGLSNSVTHPSTVHSTPATPSTDILKQGLDSSKPYKSGAIESRQHVDRAPSVPISCRPAHLYDLHCVAKLSDGLKIFIPRGQPKATDQDIDLAMGFRPYLERCCAIYGCRYDAIAMFMSTTDHVAFNHGGSLFFNLKVYAEQHAKGMSSDKLMDYWFTVMAHELAHNLVSDHGEQHSFYTEFYIQEYLDRLRSS